MSPVEYNLRLARAKAHALAEAHAATAIASTQPAYYLGSDTIVELDGAILEKPRDRDDAKRMIGLLSGRRHRVHTAVALYRLGPGVGNHNDNHNHNHNENHNDNDTNHRNNDNDNDTNNRNNHNDTNNHNASIALVDSFVDTATVTFATLTERDIEAYVATGEPMDKAGSYGIQGIGGQFVASVEGDFFTVMGLPMHKTSRLIASALQAEGRKE